MHLEKKLTIRQIVPRHLSCSPTKLPFFICYVLELFKEPSQGYMKSFQRDLCSESRLWNTNNNNNYQIIIAALCNALIIFVSQVPMYMACPDAD